MEAGGTGGGLDLREVGIGAGEGDVVADRGADELDVLEKDADSGVELVLSQAAQIDAVEGDAPALGVPQPGQEGGDRGLARPRGTDQCRDDAGLQAQADIAQHGVAGVVGEGDALQGEAAGTRSGRSGIGGRADAALGGRGGGRRGELRGAEEGLEGVARLEARHERSDAGGDAQQLSPEGGSQDEEGQQLGRVHPTGDHHEISAYQQQPENRGGTVEHDGDDLDGTGAHLPVGDEIARLGQGAGEVHDGGGSKYPRLLARGDEGLGLCADPGGVALGAGDVVGVAPHDADHDDDVGQDRQKENERQPPLDAEEVDQDDERGGDGPHAIGLGMGDYVVEGVHVVAHDLLDLSGAAGGEPAQRQSGELVHEPTAQGGGEGGVVHVERHDECGGADGGQAHDDAGDDGCAQEVAEGRAREQKAGDIRQEDEGNDLKGRQEDLDDARNPYGPPGGRQDGCGRLLPGLHRRGGGSRGRGDRGRVIVGGIRRRSVGGTSGVGSVGVGSNRSAPRPRRIRYGVLGLLVGSGAPVGSGVLIDWHVWRIPGALLLGLVGGIELGQGARLAQCPTAHPVGLGMQGGLVQTVLASQQ